MVCAEGVPQGKLLIRTRPMPADTNAYGDVFAGWLMAQMDASCAILAHQIAQGRVATVAVTDMAFFKPIKVGDMVCCYGQCLTIGNRSMRIKMAAWVEHEIDHQSHYDLVTEAVFTFVAIDEHGKSRVIAASL